jgi:phosphohistidine phosphatase
VKLYVMRHGPAEDQSASGADEERALTPPGRERVRSVAKTLAAIEEAPLWIVSSPLVRALQTAEIVAAATKLTDRAGNVEARRELAPGGDAQGLIQELLAAERKRCMVVGHEPDLSGLVAALVGEPLLVAMDKAMVVGLAVKPGSAALRFVLDPKVLALSIDLRGA